MILDIYYMVVPVSEVTQDILLRTSTRTLAEARKSTDGTLCILEVEGDIPPELWGYQAIYSEKIHDYLLHHEEIWGDHDGDGQIGLMGQFLNLFRLS